MNRNRKMYLSAFFGHIFVVTGFTGFIGLYACNEDALPNMYWSGWFVLGLILVFIAARDYYRKQKATPLYIFGISLFVFTAIILPTILPFSRAVTALTSNMTAAAVIMFLSLEFWRHRWKIHTFSRKKE